MDIYTQVPDKTTHAALKQLSDLFDNTRTATRQQPKTPATPRLTKAARADNYLCIWQSQFLRRGGAVVSDSLERGLDKVVTLGDAPIVARFAQTGVAALK